MYKIVTKIHDSTIAYFVTFVCLFLALPLRFRRTGLYLKYVSVSKAMLTSESFDFLGPSGLFVCLVGFGVVRGGDLKFSLFFSFSSFRHAALPFLVRGLPKAVAFNSE